MAKLQPKESQKLLRFIYSSVADGRELTYLEAAKLMGREPARNHSRAIAQMCDLLDAAACLAGVPLFALVKVLAKSGKVNPKAWKREYGPRREAIIKRSQGYKFGSSDIKKISRAINDLGERGNRKAWEYLKSLYPGDLLYRRVTGDYTDPTLNAVDDLGMDVPDRAKSQVWSYLRDQKVRDAVLLRAMGKCELCGKPGFIKRDGFPYLESHHIIALANEGADRLTNVIALCPNDHREAHFGRRANQIEKQMIRKLRKIQLIDLGVT